MSEIGDHLRHLCTGGYLISPRISCLPCSTDSQSIGRYVARVIRVPLQPLKLSYNATTGSLIDTVDDLFHYILVLNRFFCGRHPSIASPRLAPDRCAIDSIVAVRVDSDRTVQRSDVEGTLYGGQLSTLICLTRTSQWFGHISAVVVNPPIVDGSLNKSCTYLGSPGPK